MDEKQFENYLRVLNPKKDGDKAWFLTLLDEEQQRVYEEEHVEAVMRILRAVRIRPHKIAIKKAQEEIATLQEIIGS